MSGNETCFCPYRDINVQDKSAPFGRKYGNWREGQAVCHAITMAGNITPWSCEYPNISGKDCPIFKQKREGIGVDEYNGMLDYARALNTAMKILNGL